VTLDAQTLDSGGVPTSRRAASGAARRRVAALVGLGALLALTGALALTYGAADLPARRVGAALAEALGLSVESPVAPWERTIVLGLRLPRLVQGILVGAALALGGALMQGIFRNPLADPSLIGVSSGAALGASTMIVLGPRLELSGAGGGLAVPVAAFFGALAAAALVHRLSVRKGRSGAVTMLLCGIAINAFASAGTGLWTFVADDRELRDLTFWTLGSLGGASWSQLAVLTAFVGVGAAVALRATRELDVMLLGEAEAGHVGVDAERLRRRAVGATAAMVGVAVAVSGLIFFVGLVVPHMVRLASGPRHALLLPASALLGSTILVGADVAARWVVAPSELPIGIVTALLGAPFFLALIHRSR
jgi:iron complex transport system permease protein